MHRTTHARRGFSPPLPLSVLIGLLALSVASFGVGCASKQKTSDREAQKVAEADDARGDQKDRDTVPTPTGDELADSPCGNPDWARLPPEHREDGDPSSQKTPADSEADAESDNGPKAPDSEPDEDDE